MIYGITLIVAFCSIVYELLLAQTLSIVLGSTVLQYSITIGVYLAALGAGSILCQGGHPDDARRLLRVELALSLVGGASVMLENLWEVLLRFVALNHGFAGTPLGMWALWAAYVGANYGVILIIGILSGFELPLLIALRAREKEGTLHQVLAADYLGSLVGALLFPLWLYPALGLFAAAFLTALVNAGVCAILPTRSRRQLPYLVGTGLLILLWSGLLLSADRVEQFFLGRIYFYSKIHTLSQLFDPSLSEHTLEVFHSPYQQIHLAHLPDSEEEYRAWGCWSEKFRREPDFPKGWELYLNRAYQFGTGVEEFYHEFLAHVPIQWNGLPRRVLLLGGGDGLLARELLKYPDLERLTLVEIDPVMLDLARHHPLFLRVNHQALADPRVRLVQADAFAWLRQGRERYDAIYVDMPDPQTYELSRLYSVEFYSLIRRRLAPGGFVAADVPDSNPEEPYAFWSRYSSTFRAAGFRQVRSFTSELEADNACLDRLESEWMQGAAARALSREAATPDATFLHRYFRNRLDGFREDVRSAFVFLRVEPAPLPEAFRDDGIPLYVLNGRRLRLVARSGYRSVFNPAQVNSVFRPTIPATGEFLSLLPAGPY